MFIDKLTNIVERNDSLVCVGLDTDIEKIPDFLLDYNLPIFEFNRRIIKATKDIVIAYKFNMAFYEKSGLSGLISLQKSLEQIPDDIITIIDAKKGDIGNTAKAYAKAVFETIGCDATTVNPYLGYDSVEPFLQYRDKCVFVLCRTTNRSARDFQDLNYGKRLYQIVAEKIRDWNIYKNCGIVAGATYPDELKDIRGIVGEYMPILIPGIGKQGGDIEKTVKFGTNSQGAMAIINSSRSIIFASEKDDFDAISREKAEDLRNKINKVRLSL